MMKRLLLLLIPLLVLGLINGAAQQLPIRGKVTDEAGKPIAGASVTIKGTQISTSTDDQGNFQLSGPSAKKVVVLISFIGFSPEEREVTGKPLAIHMHTEARSLNDVVVVGYGTQRKREVTGATSSVKAEEIAKRPLTRVEEALQGTAPGVSVESTSGQPGVPLAVRIRGANSITGSNEPLYVIDGFIGGNIESISPGDIETLEILKDASATAIYGSRGSNGVVMITTKNGKEGKPRIDFSTWVRKAMVPKELSLMDAYDFASTVNAENAQNGQAPGFSQAQLTAFQSNKGTDWQNALQTKPWQSNFALTLSGGSANVNYLFTLDHLDQPGLILNQWYKRTTFRSNVGVKINDRFNLQFNIAGVIPTSRNTGYQGDITDPFAQAYQWDPTSPVRDSLGNFILRSQFGSNAISPVAQASNQQVDASSYDITGSARLTYKILDGLTFTSDNFYELNSNEQQYVYGLQTSEGLVGQDYAKSNNAHGYSYQNSNVLTYKRKFGDHALTLTAVYEQAVTQAQNVTAQSNNLSTYSLGYWNLGLGATQSISSGYSKSATQSYVGRLNYSYKDRYILTASIRDDGSSHLIQKYATFPSVGVAWNITKEKFMEQSKVFSDLKLRGSYGVSGNQAVGAYATIAQINVGGVENATAYFYDGTTPTRYTPLGTPVSSSLKWENDAQKDIGIDAGFLNNRITFTADAYYKHVTNLLYNKTAPQYLGGGTYATNLGSLENKGIEFGIGATPVNSGKFKWTTYYNMSFNRNKVLTLSGLDNVLQNNIGSAQQGVSILKVGQPLGEFFGYKFLGTWKTSEAAQAAVYGNKPGDGKFADLNKDGVINGSDETTIGNGNPNYTFGFINDLSYGDFTLSFMLQGTHGNELFSGTFPYTMGGLGDARNATSTDILKRWTPANQTDIPAFSSSSQNPLQSSRWVYDASYIKLKNLAFTYHLPVRMLNQLKLKNLEIYVSGQNLFCITHYPGYDPEISNETNAMTQGLETGVIPNPRTYTFGLRAGF